MVNHGADTRVVDTAALPNGVVPLRVTEVVRETDDAVTLVLDVPADRPEPFAYRAGQFLTLVLSIDGQQRRRSYSMSSAPAVDDALRITVKRDRDGVVSNWLNDTAAPGDWLYAFSPAGRFVLNDADHSLIAFAGGSGITPVYSLLRSALASTVRTARLFYANRERRAVIFDQALALLAGQHGDRFALHHHLDDASGIVTAAHVDAFLRDVDDAEFYVCGPNAFMQTVCDALRAAGVPTDRLHVEHFDAPAAAGTPPDTTAVVPDELIIVLNGQRTTAPYSAGDTVLQTARMAGLRAPSSCETGSCATCMARVTSGSARMINNGALEDDEVDDGWVLTCQAIPTSSTIRVEYV